MCPNGWVGRCFAGIPLKLLVPVLVLLTPAMVRADYVDEWGPAIGSSVPPLEVSDQDGRMRTLDDLSGEQGLLLFLNRSADW